MVVSTIERDGELVWAPPEPRRLDLHSWIAITVAALVTVGTLTLAGIAYAHVP